MLQRIAWAAPHVLSINCICLQHSWLFPLVHTACTNAGRYRALAAIRWYATLAASLPGHQKHFAVRTVMCMMHSVVTRADVTTC